MNLYQDKFQELLKFRDQYMAMRKVCDELELKFGRCLDDLKAELKEKGINKLTSTQLKKTVDKNEEEHHSIPFYTKLTNHIMRNS
jgi:hypothetical protein